MILGGFRLICGNCGSDKVLEKSGRNKLDWVADKVKYGEGIQRKCIECSNEEFIIIRTWLQEE